MSNPLKLDNAGRRRVLRNVGLAAGGIAIVSAGFMAGRLFDRRGDARQLELAADIPGFLWPNPPNLPEFELVDHEARPFDRARLLGHWTMIYFGYTSCPDVCPISLSVMGELARDIKNQPALADTFQALFVSVDPDRDRDRIGDYVQYFGPDFIGATGDEKALMGIARPLGVVYMRHKPDDKGHYLVDHSNSILLIDPRGRLVGVFNGPHEKADMLDRLKRMQAIVG